MNNTTTTRVGRYTGPSLQADGVVTQSTNHTTRTTYTVEKPKLKKTRAEIDAQRNSMALADLAGMGGICAFGAWQTGTGNFKKARQVPEGAVIWSKSDAESFQYMQDTPAKPPRAPAHICAWFAAHPRALRCVALIEAAKAATKRGV